MTTFALALLLLAQSPSLGTLAGEYRWGGGADEVSLNLLKDGAFTFRLRIDGSRDDNEGSAALKNGILLLSCKRPNVLAMYKGVDTELVPVAWGHRMYLVPKLPRDGVCGLLDFCQQVNSGSEPRQTDFGLVFLRRGDENRPVQGLPSVPEEFRKYLLKAPVLANVLAFDGDKLTINAGSNQGLFVGQRLYVLGRDCGVVVRRLSSASSQLQLVPAMSDMPSWTPNTVHVGDVVSTRWNVGAAWGTSQDRERHRKIDELAGEYHLGGGNWDESVLKIDKDGNFTFNMVSIHGDRDSNEGLALPWDGMIKLTFKRENVLQVHRGVDTELMPIVWGERLYLVPRILRNGTDGVREFCQDVNDGREPRSGPGNWFYLRAGDEKKAVSGKPDVPEQYRKYLLPKPIAAKVLAASDPSLTIDAGSAQGLFVGLTLYTTDPVGFATVQSVGDRTAVLAVVYAWETFSDMGRWPKKRYAVVGDRVVSARPAALFR